MSALAGKLSLAEYVEYRQGPRAAEYSAQANRWIQMREMLLRNKGNICFKDADSAKGFVQALYGLPGLTLLRDEEKTIAPGESKDVNLRSLCILTLTKNKEGHVTHAIRPLDGHDVKTQIEEIASLFQQAIREARRSAETPTIKSQPIQEVRRSRLRR